jgi:hypothetical protein
MFLLDFIGVFKNKILKCSLIKNKKLDGVVRALGVRRSQRSVIGWVTKIDYLELLRASEGTLSRWSRLHLQSFVPTTVSRKVYVRPVVETIAESLSRNDKNILYRPHLVG